MYIIPAIDLIEGKAVRLTQGDYSQKKEYNARPLEVAQQFEDAGLTRLHLVDLDGAKEKRVINWKVLELIASKTKLHIDFGGGVQSDEDLRVVFECGAKQVTGGSIAVKQPEVMERWLSQLGSEAIILGADAKNEKIAVSGWEESTEVWVYDFVEKWVEKGISYVISTDVAKDGLLQGPSFELYRNLQDQFPKLNVIASGGVSNMADIETLADMNLFGVIVGKAIYEGRVTLKELSRFMGV
ncbi:MULTISPECIES: 1-(5-phosphoribosyl)-5-[(5-phosphoribosylamino)methylideneamino]imidazole-4-carboxamide isomerase [unclassified Spirosoma]|uniref:1-(5-phosphoribosyl)-5-[(5- phosphoribosylamino)methylideneamino]imidazole-4- carboxamide isomerase n=1 Tax=unclassified Spirosoma TaxID=2621999 RepID=UPI00095D0912|nr:MULTISPECIES: 1-(5-phosphoribosyl)-5-[(5-phosphoribosylamino)methylideneamino]imidazole-4-carboxamide isomerase [unclassified Spirosoma]MBN8825075.1 1-(5-phosphoribosyl)-5-[(5-phosphoribosylamino)methylideneamino]imidazole-4-carboxamide isomerase [Spirosoma sp.]OJW73362.1 MAG: 1-(5-phosphoribosyl)-5-[(5-phosphoribosylamino)methylideneamino]imidazole-4-carboxamide isomerase [Spirosoma sp. 48-14]